MIDTDMIAEITASIKERIMREGISDDDLVKDMIETEAFSRLSEMTIDDIVFTVDKVFSNIRSRYGPLDPYIEDDAINEIMVNGTEKIFIEKGNELVKIRETFDTVEELESVIRKIAAMVHREVSEMHPILDARLMDGSRVNAVLKNVALNGPSLTIRKFRKERITMAEMISSGSLSSECAEFLKLIVSGGYNVFVSGGTSSGKTTFLNALADYIPSAERVIVIEDSSELQMDKVDNIIRMECKNANFMGAGQITMSGLIKTSLRMRPDKIVIGEVRGAEVSDMLQALNTGHSGMSTGHGNSCKGMLRRMEAMYLMGSQIPMDAIRSQITEAIDIMVHLCRLHDGRRIVLEVNELTGMNNGEYVLNRLYYCDENFKLKPSGKRMKNTLKLKLSGLEGEYDRLQDVRTELA